MPPEPEPELSAEPPQRLSERLAPLTAGRDRWVLGVVCLAAVVGAWILRFAQDDAFITYRFSRNLAEGRGLVFNPGERVEGYTNFLWTLYLALPEWLGWDTPTFSVISGIVLMVATILVAWRLAHHLLDGERAALLAVVVLVANVSFLGYGTGGLETMLQTLLVATVALLVVAPAEVTPRRRVAAGVAGGLAVLTRLDSTVLVGALFVASLWRGGLRRGATRDDLRALVAPALQMGLPVLALVVPWLVWKLDYYGNLLPNTFYAKSTGNPLVPILYGVVYLLAFFASYAAFLLIGRWRRHRRELLGDPRRRALAAICVLWGVYICYVGADFMEFRFVVPVLPFLAIGASFLVDRYRSTARQVVLVGVLLVVSGLHAVLPGMQYPVLTFKDLRHWPTDSPTSWAGMGEVLAEAFPGSLDDPARPTIALTPLGVIPYVTDLRTVDMLGLADPEIAREGESIPLYYPGHVRMATVDQLVAKDVDLVIGQPTPIEPLETDSVTLAQLVGLYPATDLRRLPDGAEVIEITLTPDRAWYLISLRPHPQVTAAVERFGWRILEIERTCELRDLELSGLARWVYRQSAQRTCPDV